MSVSDFVCLSVRVSVSSLAIAAVSRAKSPAGLSLWLYICSYICMSLCLFVSVYVRLFVCVCVSVEDAGRYTCIAENDAGQASMDIDLVVHGLSFLLS